MFTEQYAIFIEKFANRHYLRLFEKKYRGRQWEVTLVAIKEVLSRYDKIAPKHKSLLSKLDIIGPCGKEMIIKFDFMIAGSKVSAKASGNRLIAAVNSDKRVIRILLLYSKNEIGHPNESGKWKKIIASNYPEFKSLK